MKFLWGMIISIALLIPTVVLVDHVCPDIPKWWYLFAGFGIGIIGHTLARIHLNTED